MDYSSKVDAAKRMIESKGAAATVVALRDGSYSATSDSISATAASYSAIIVLSNPTMENDAGEFSKSDKVRLIIAASGMPTLDKINYKVVCGSDEWYPEKTVAVKPGGTPIIYLADMK